MGDRGSGPGGPGPAFGEPEPQAPAAAAEPPGDGEQAQAELFRFPAAGVPGQGEQLGPSRQFAGQGGDLAPELVPGGAFQRQVPQAGVLRAPDPVLAPGPAAVP